MYNVLIIILILSKNNTYAMEQKKMIIAENLEKMTENREKMKRFRLQPNRNLAF